jgi:amino acid adenylation domain-containing protein
MDLASRIAKLPPAKRALLEFAVNSRLSSNDPGVVPLIPHWRQRDRIALSFAQQRLWFLDRLHPGKADYNLPHQLLLEGPLNIAALCDALNAVVARHESLRTSFGKLGDESFQRIAAELILELPVVDLRDHDIHDDELKRLIHDESDRPFDLSAGPLLRAKLFRLAVDHHILLVVMHHIVSDGWSMTVFNRELGTLYNAYCRNQGAPLPPLPVQYPDYAVWQRQNSDRLGLQLEYWKRQLSGAPQILELPIDTVRPLVQSFRGTRFSIDLPPRLGAALKSLAQRENATLFMVMLAAYQLLLHRYSAQDDILVGIPVAGRTQPELEDLIGFFVNSLVIRCRLTPEHGFRRLLAEIRDTAVEAFSHQELPFEKLVEALAPQRDMSRNPIFQVMFSLQNDASPSPQMDRLAVSNMELDITKAKFDLTLFISESDAGLRANFNYAADLFQSATIERMAGHYVTLLTAITKAPELSIGHLPLLTDEEQAQLARWNRTASNFPRTSGIQQLFELQAAATPQACAISHKDTKISYEMLNRRANQLARHLNAHSVPPGTLIGLCMERGIDAVVALLAILKAGGAYVPLDPNHPRERLGVMIEDAGLRIVICHTAQQASLPSYQVDLIAIDRDREHISACRGDNPPPAANGDSLAYVLYTSGSTGKPKGVCIPHKAVNRLVKNTDYVALGTDDVIAQAANMAFDAATFEIWGALLNGCRLHIIPKGTLLSQVELCRELHEQGVTTLFLTTALFNQMILQDAGVFRGLKQLLFGGEACDPQRIRECLEATPPRRLIHVYGPTESTTFTTWFEIHAVEQDARTVPIGHPIANTTCHVLDAHRQPVPVGITGELYIGGDGVAREYLGRPELNAEKFIINPLDDGDRLYRSGDLVRYRADGAIEFVGRVDHQIKLRGFRIEPGEIDEALKKHPALRDCFTMPREDTPGEKRLVSYVAVKPNHVADEQTLRHHLKEALPEYMIPAAFVIVDALPLTSNGKVDRQALPPPATVASNDSSTAPRTALELHLTKIWEDILDRKPIGIRDNFFELGGHSLLAARLFDQIEQHFGKKLPLDTLWFEGATVETLAGILDREKETISWPELVEIKAGEDMAPLFCVHTMGGNLFHYYELARTLARQLPVYGLQARGVYGKYSPRDDVADIAADCIKAMRQRQPHGPYRVAGFSSGGIVAFEMAQQLRAAGEKVSTLALLDCFAPGVKLKSTRLERLRRLLNRNRARHLQERLYYHILQPLGLRRLRQMRTIGEAHRWAHWNYKPFPYPDPIDLFIATESEKRATDPLLGWEKLAAGDLSIHPISGTHGLLVKSPHVEELAEKLQRLLDR